MDDLLQKISALGNFEYLKRYLLTNDIDNSLIDEKTLEELCARYPYGHSKIQVGTERIVFQVPNKFVLKIALSEQGVSTNSAESNPHHEFAVAYAEEVQIPGIKSAIIMEWVDNFADKIVRVIPASGEFTYECSSPDASEKTIVLSEEELSWVLTIDCCQVGFTNANRLVAYDLGRVAAEHTHNQLRSFDKQTAIEFCKRLCRGQVGAEKLVIDEKDVFWR
ncbi:hypothetical protein MHJ92_08325 [Corynebacterium amycolatum]|uniref:hypothetical protein n=1 Tax=Corynebacterium amycolatum TaxID=43765 RepID=UPI001EF409FC|nr:hypothetical protein [Corynebacterium amycolatum]MCG7270022.1 hypothetical protein [Corynebacterium amycolatum]